MLTDLAKIALKLSGVLTSELQEDAQDVVAPDHVELVELEESSSSLSEQLCIINREVTVRINGIKNFKLNLLKWFFINFLKINF